jgi:hypothetical protein
MKTLRQIIEESKLIDGLNSELEQHYNPADYTPDEKDSLKHYTTSRGSSAINNVLWNNHLGEGSEDHETEYLNQHEPHLDSALAKKRTPKAFTVYSATRHNPKNRIFGTDNTLEFPAYTSTSINPEVAFKHAHTTDNQGHYHAIKFHVPAEFKGAAFLNKDLSSIPSEQEVLLKKGLKARYTGKTTIVKYNEQKKYNMKNQGESKIIHLHHMTIEHDNENS